MVFRQKDKSSDQKFVWTERTRCLNPADYQIRGLMQEFVCIRHPSTTPATSSSASLTHGQAHHKTSLTKLLINEESSYVRARKWIISLSLPVLTAIFQVNLGQPVPIEAKDDGGGGVNWSYKLSKAPAKSSPTNQHPVFLQAGCPSCRPTNSVKALKGRGSESSAKIKHLFFQKYHPTQPALFTANSSLPRKTCYASCHFHCCC